jgi:hypothetical protein
MIPLAEMRETRPMEVHGEISTTTDVWSMLTAAKDGDLERIRQLVEKCPALAHCQYDYTAPLHLAVREGRLETVRYLIQNGALDPGYKTHPFLEPLTMVADDRGYNEIARILEESLDDPALLHEWGDTGKIEHGLDETERRFQDLVGQSKYEDVEALLKERPALAYNELAFWGEGILCMPAKNGDFRMLNLLMEFGARVPDLSKWGERYYFKHDDVAKFLLENGMNPNHSNWHYTTLLQDKARLGDIEKASLLLDHGADIDAIDEEFQSTALGFAARWGQREMAAFLIERGADLNRSGAPWATPLAWSRKKGHTSIETDLIKAGALMKKEN